MSRTLGFTSDFNARYVPPSELARAALGYIATPERWMRGDYMEGDASCAMGAIARASTENKLAIVYVDYNQMMAQLLMTLKEAFPDIEASTVDEFNDHPAVQHKDIVAAFEKTATYFEEMGR